jgi:hypothetical protein
MFPVLEMSAAESKDLQFTFHVPRDPGPMNSRLAIAKAFCTCIGAVHARILAIAFYLQLLEMSIETLKISM